MHAVTLKGLNLMSVRTPIFTAPGWLEKTAAIAGTFHHCEKRFFVMDVDSGPCVTV